MKKRIRDLERLLGKKTMEVEILKEAIEITREKTDLAHAIAHPAQCVAFFHGMRIAGLF